MAIQKKFGKKNSFCYATGAPFEAAMRGPHQSIPPEKTFHSIYNTPLFGVPQDEIVS